MGIAQDCAAVFQEQGYVVLRKIFAPGRVAELKEICDSVLSRKSLESSCQCTQDTAIRGQTKTPSLVVLQSGASTALPKTSRVPTAGGPVPGFWYISTTHHTLWGHTSGTTCLCY